jgi:two-component system nitrate/nitrite response regulator NarL
MRLPIVVTHPSTLFHDALRRLLAKSHFRLMRIDSSLSEELETHLRSLESCIWLIGVERCLSSTNTLVRRVVTTTPGVKAVILAAYQTPNDIIPALEAGACGFLCQDIPAERLLKSLELIMLGEVVVHPEFSWGQKATQPIQANGETNANGSMQTYNGEPYPRQPFASQSSASIPLVAKVPSSKSPADCVAPSLSRREMLILRMLIEGASNKTIALRLVITESTVKVHMKAILRKLRLQNRTQAAIWASSHFNEGGWNSSVGESQAV